MLNWIVVTSPALCMRYSPRAYQVIIETSVLVTIPVCLFLFIVSICLTNLLVAQLLDSISQLSPRKLDDGNQDPPPFTSLYCNCIHEALQNAILHIQTGTSWIEYSIGAVKLLFSVNFHKKFHDFALRLSLRLSQSYHDAYSNMQGYARLNRASITNTTVQDCHYVESFCATIKVESSPLSPSLQSADSPS